MANVERDDEKDAKRIVERVLGVSLRHFDTDGGVDYLAPDGGVAVEVTRVTDGRKRSARSGLSKSAADIFDPPLASCWIVLVRSTHPSTKNLERQLRTLFAECEKSGIAEFNRDDTTTYMTSEPSRRVLYQRLDAMGIESAGPPMLQGDPPGHQHQIHIALTTDGTIESSDTSLRNLMAELGRKTDNRKKLSDSRALRRILFAWLDGDTPYEIVRPLDGEAPPGLERHFGPPSIAPELDPAITELWIVHDGTRRGWRWDGTEWSTLEGV